MASYHESATPTATGTVHLRPYEYAVLPPIGRVLAAIRAHCGVGGTIQPGVRTLATRAEYRSAGQIAPLLQQLADDGWILYDPTSGCITLLAESEPISPTDQDAISAADRLLDEDDSAVITATDRPISPTDRSEPISTPDRTMRRPNRLLEAISRRDRSAPRMEDIILAAADSDSDSAAARSRLPCTAESISPADRLFDSPAALVLAELGAEPAIIADALTARPDLTPAQVRASWSHFEPRIASGRCDAGAFFHAIRNGRLHAAPRELPIDPADYADNPQFLLGSSPEPESDAQEAREEALRQAHWRAKQLAPRGTSYMDMAVLVHALADGATDDQALDVLAQYQRPGPAGAGGAP